MNEGVISGYENFFSGSGLPSDLAVEMASSTSIHPVVESDYHKDTAPLTQLQHQHVRRFHHQSVYNSSFASTNDMTQTVASVPGNGNSGNVSAFTQIPFVQIHTTDVQPQSAFNSTRFRRSATSSHEEIKAEPIKSENAEGAKERINATPTPPGSAQQTSENNTTKSLIQNEKDICAKKKKANLDARSKNANVSNIEDSTICSSEDTSHALPAIHKCHHCAFISLCESGLQLHVDAMHQVNFQMCANSVKRPSIQCPGCENVFYAFTVMEIHLREDHLMAEQDIIVLLRALKNKSQVTEHTTSTNNLKTTDEASPTEISMNGMNGTQRRSRIYLKNVECLREPHRDPIEQQDNLITDSLFHFENDDCNTLVNIGSISMEEQDLIGMLTNSEPTYHNKSGNSDTERMSPAVDENKSRNPPKQKISIKSVDVLREPALVRRDYEMQSFDDFINVCSDLNLHVANNSETNNVEVNDARDNHDNVQFNNYPVVSNREPLLGTTSDTVIADFANDYDKPRRPKIYIKNVDILKEPMTFSNNINAPNLTESTSNVMNFNFMQPTLPQIATSYLETVDNLNATVPTFNGGMSQIPLGTISDQYLFESAGSNFLVNTTSSASADNYAYGNEPNSESFLMESSRFTITPNTITPIITEPTPPPPPMGTSMVNTSNCTGETPPAHHSTALINVQKQKIFIKNVDILKEPQFQEPRGLLHLRTVDELNLMNRREVENLIAPNLEGNQTNMAEEEINDSFTKLKKANGESQSTVENCNDSNAIEAISYGCEGFKLNEFSTPNSWHDDYDLGEDIREIITSTMAPNLPTSQKIIHDLDTPQVSLISIPDMEELTVANVGVNGGTVLAEGEETALATGVVQQQNNTNFTFECEASTVDIIQEPVCSADNPSADPVTVCNDTLPEMQKEHEPMGVCQLTSTPEVLKQERLNPAPPVEKSDKVPSQKNYLINFGDIPPLTPMSTATCTINTSANTATSIVATSGLPVPPLVPMLSTIQMSKTVTATNTGSTTSTPAERGRIYVANNLMQAPSATLLLQTSTASSIATTNQQGKQQTKTPIAVSVMGGTSVRGRPFGSNRTGITKLRKQPLNGDGAGVYLKCTVAGCVFRFKKSSTLEYHMRCHSNDSSPPSKACPECKGSFTNWNSLHTHLWRTHKIDMELYSCELCSFKTPIYSRLLNTHSKIHYDERNYKCDQCEKAFKNTKQLKNHRRWHRNHNKATSTSATTKREQPRKDDAITSESQDPASAAAATTSVPTRNFHRCKDCDAVFSHQKSLREHLCKNAAAAVQCEVCDRVLTSRSSLKLHMQSHEPARRFKCNVCDYSTSDHNAFRRHKMTHNTNAKMYACVHCDYKSIQSVAYQKHIQQKHPQVADSYVYKCKICPYSTINKALFDIHQVKHENKNDKNEAAVENIAIETQKSCGKKNTQTTDNEPATKTKIKVKSHLLLTTPADSSMELNDICFDAVTVPA
ncbi:uncharacterized protein LOC129240758 isoform X1 [Anastrepha obliqua]|uniref:uncharacterized protein LOC129240758 isoform X1 n=2 Tax=Anastrepha obliqua TaxID=95512 RepID=UPI002408F62C|nr:uncharacterized protein LOC129240758 isoform X1 [Anastrepha obliqua]